MPTRLTPPCEAISARMVEFMCSTNLFRTSQVGIFFRQTVNAKTERVVGETYRFQRRSGRPPSSSPLSSPYLPAFRPPFVLDPTEGGYCPQHPTLDPGLLVFGECPTFAHSDAISATRAELLTTGIAKKRMPYVSSIKVPQICRRSTTVTTVWIGHCRCAVI